MSEPTCIHHSGRWVDTTEAWFGRPAGQPRGDLMIARQWPSADWQGSVSEKHTLLVDLSAAQEVWQQAYKKDTQYQVRRAETKDQLGFRLLDAPSAAEVQQYGDFYDAFAAQKSLPLCDRHYLLQAAQAGALLLSWAEQDGAPLVTHSYILSRGRARLLQSASLFRASADSAQRTMIGRANRWLHFKDMQALKAAGCSTYDFGGWYAGSTDKAKLQINAFKEEFGGQVTREYDGVFALTWRGRLYRWLRQLRGKA
ncbi:hypothetical protein GTP58_29810 [Duganella sp. CY15W]|uniref:hypothetical protein n=1 Tax=Duganella sp. CY15W TaxID=2692172 RepID=UPI00136A1A05|nr:hypothetical protein [Duganella sp. CY15W]MYM32537.1 hypothetical protein [Duganella sp. CY15W]